VVWSDAEKADEAGERGEEADADSGVDEACEAAAVHVEAEVAEGERCGAQQAVLVGERRGTAGLAAREGEGTATMRGRSGSPAGGARDAVGEAVRPDGVRRSVDTGEWPTVPGCCD